MKVSALAGMNYYLAKPATLKLLSNVLAKRLPN
jgi:hypothetical protein